MNWVIWTYQEYNKYHFEYRQQDVRSAYTDNIKLQVLEKFLKSKDAKFYVDMGIPLTVEQEIWDPNDGKLCNKLCFNVIAHTINEEQTIRTREKRITDKLTNAYN
jgi:hypothetical protein|tara:strand:- start:226 stop:540 length:315 start_codon:yes stop_codon:yes gene_type:complete